MCTQQRGMLYYIITILLFFSYNKQVFALDICNTHFEKTSSELDLATLHNFCSSDEICAYYFNQKITTINITTFELLALPIYSEDNMDLNFVIDSLCSVETPTDLLKYLWVRELVYKRSTNTIFCGPSQTLKINGDNSVSCVCSAESDCEDADNDQSLLITLLVLLIISTFILLVMFVCNNQFFIWYTDFNK